MDDFESQFEQIKIFYKSLDPLACPALKGKLVYFTESGFIHLRRKGIAFRPQKNQIRRAALLRHAPLVISSAEEIHEYRTKSNSEFWAIISIVNGKLLKVVLRKQKKTPIHFYSIMDI